MVKDVIDINYLKNESISRKILYVGDTILMSLLYLFLGLGTSTFINKRICRSLDKSKGRVYLFFETTGESLLVIIVLFLIIFYVERLPIIVPKPDIEHLKFRRRAEDIILAFATVFGHEKLLEKYDYLLGNTD
jgi:hypothetical protein